MKIIVIGDIHGHDSWKQIIVQEQTFDKVIFLGDYWDSFHVPVKQQLGNYLDIQKFRDNNPDTVITLLGNHDYHYIYPTQYSGWKLNTKLLATPLLNEDLQSQKLPFVYRYEDILFSHAGVTNYWLREVAKCTLEELQFNEVQLRLFDWNGRMGNDPYGDTISNSPLWVRPKSLKKDALLEHRQVVGHTNFCQIRKHKGSLYFCDTLPFEYLVIEDGEFIIKELSNKECA